MTVINVTAALTALGGATPVTSGRITVEYLRGTRGEPAARREGAEVLLPAPVVATIADGVTTTPLDVPPTDGTCYARIWVEARAPRDGGYLELPAVAIPATGPVDIADLVAVDPASYEPITSVVTAWELAVGHVDGVRSAVDAAAVQIADDVVRSENAAQDAAGFSAAAEFDAGTAGQSAFQAGQSAATALGHRNAAKDSADAAALAAGSITKDVPGGVPSLDGNARVPDARLPERLGQQQLLGTFVSVLAAAKNPDLLITGNITRDANQAVTSADVVWPDGAPGTFTALTLSTAFPGAVDSYKITYGSPVTKTFTQPAITRNSAGAATTVPQIVVS